MNENTSSDAFALGLPKRRLHHVILKCNVASCAKPFAKGFGHGNDFFCSSSCGELFSMVATCSNVSCGAHVQLGMLKEGLFSATDGGRQQFCSSKCAGHALPVDSDSDSESDGYATGDAAAEGSRQADSPAIAQTSNTADAGGAPVAHEHFATWKDHDRASDAIRHKVSL